MISQLIFVVSAGLPVVALKNYGIGLVVVRTRVCGRGKRKSGRIKEYYTIHVEAAEEKQNGVFPTICR